MASFKLHLCSSTKHSTTTQLPSHFNMYMALPQHTVWWVRLNPISSFGHDVQDQGSTYVFSTNSYYNWPVHQHVGLISTEWQTLILTCTACVLSSGVCQKTNHFKAALLTKVCTLNSDSDSDSEMFFRKEYTSCSSVTSCTSIHLTESRCLHLRYERMIWYGFCCLK